MKFLMSLPDVKLTGQKLKFGQVRGFSLLSKYLE